jgi:hypothetical protein
LDCHSSIAFGVGYIIGTKSGFNVAPIQKSISGKAIWKISNPQQVSPNLWSFSNVKIKDEDGDVALVLSITHAIANDVQDYITHCLPDISRIIICHPESGVGSNAISDGEHAYNLVIQLVHWLRQNRNIQKNRLRCIFLTRHQMGLCSYLVNILRFLEQFGFMNMISITQLEMIINLP